MPEPGGRPWAKEPGAAMAITSLIRDLSLGDAALSNAHPSAPPSTSHYTTVATSQAPTAPPSKRQCRSLSLSDEFGGFRSSWRPQGSRVWTAVEKRRCYSGGSVRRLPAHPHFTASPVSPTTPSSQFPQSYRGHCLRPLSLSHEQISLPQLQREEASEASSPDSTPELGRRSGQRGDGKGCLSRSRSQPCVLNDKKIGMKRRRPEDAQEQRPSLDLAKMTQVSCNWPTRADKTHTGKHLPRSRGESTLDLSSRLDLHNISLRVVPGASCRRDVPGTPQQAGGVQEAS
uniref:Family with sequence similarity 53 member B n=1 Tax=Hippocampus comes TaxID=109280 RepID=A0A3Q2Z978_HIPCM